MEALKRFGFGTLLLSALAFFGTGTYNTYIMETMFSIANDLNIKFAKRLDEMTGEFIEGRYTASEGRRETFKLMDVEEENVIAKLAFSEDEEETNSRRGGKNRRPK